MTGQCVICTRDNPTGYVCTDCTTRLAGDLYTLAWLAAELTVTRTRQDRLAINGIRGHPKHKGPPHCQRCAPDPTDPISLPASALPVHLGAGDTYDALHNTLVGWVRNHHNNREPWPANTPAAMVTWLLDRTTRITNDPGADQLALNIEHHTKTALDIINPPDPSEQTYGVCGAERRDRTTCTAYLYGDHDASWVRCRACGTQHDTRLRTRLLEQRMRVMYFRAATLARLLPRILERPVSASNIRNWAKDGRPIRTSIDHEGFITYHCGDVRDVALATPKRNRGKEGSAA